MEDFRFCISNMWNISGGKDALQKALYRNHYVDDLHVSGGEEDNYRVRRSANPLTYIERYEMLRDTLLNFGVPREEFEIIPFPIDRVEYLGQYLPEGAVCFMSICDEWTANNEKRLRSWNSGGSSLEKD